MILEKKTLCVLVLYDYIGIANNIYFHAAICFSSFPKMMWPDGDPIITVYFKHIQGTLVAWRVQVHESGWEDWEEVHLDKIMLRNCCCVFHHKTGTCKGFSHVLDPIAHLMDSWTDALCAARCFNA